MVRFRGDERGCRLASSELTPFTALQAFLKVTVSLVSIAFAWIVLLFALQGALKGRSSLLPPPLASAELTVLGGLAGWALRRSQAQVGISRESYGVI
jgi:hypothetical protein